LKEISGYTDSKLRDAVSERRLFPEELLQSHWTARQHRHSLVRLLFRFFIIFCLIALPFDTFALLKIMAFFMQSEA
jgi:hypothetical protein